MKTSLVEENYTETKGRAEEKQADAERSGRCGRAQPVPRGTGLIQVCDHLPGHLGPVLRSPQIGGSGEKLRTQENEGSTTRGDTIEEGEEKNRQTVSIRIQ
ncbi:hypothetical protein NDU88_002158 [Pleurodeles waltl]|uniref:Uncharacterized protein n=1 Tax=Pleurodeles waltl TaxID=8319 RepID=A0AAV7M1K8_PLEWA|nr:hypothetical protein NDU88_002158 [Pleurodeles waltl]